jgi:hypothetical protein
MKQADSIRTPQIEQGGVRLGYRMVHGTTARVNVNTSPPVTKVRLAATLIATLRCSTTQRSLKPSVESIQPIATGFVVKMASIEASRILIPSYAQAA